MKSVITSDQTGELLNVIGAFLAVLSMILSLALGELPIELSITLLVVLILWMLLFVVRYGYYFVENTDATFESLLHDLF